MKGLFIFKRDLRIDDNLALNKAIEECDSVLTIYVFDKYSEAALSFIAQSLIDLNKQLHNRLYCFKGSTCSVVKRLVNKYKIDKVYMSMDYRGQTKLSRCCNLQLIENHMLTSINATKPYLVFTPYYDVVRHIPVPKPVKHKHLHLMKINAATYNFKHLIKDKYQVGGRQQGLKILKTCKSTIKHYKRDHNFIKNPSSTTHLSPHLSFGTLSVREVYHKCKNQTFRRQLYWRDFYMQCDHDRIASHVRYKWKNKPQDIRKMKSDHVGIPIIDDNIKLLKETGFIHNRARMVIANYFTQVMKCDWRIGERLFEKYLIDYDYFNNRGGWIWGATYHRVFNPELQAQKYYT